MTEVPSTTRSVRSPAAASHAMANGACPPSCRHGWKWSEMKTESSPTSSACTAYVTRSRGPNCSADAFQPTLSTVPPVVTWGVRSAYDRAVSPRPGHPTRAYAVRPGPVSRSPVHDDLVADAGLVVELDQQRLVAHVDAPVRRAGVAEAGEVGRVVHGLAAGEEHRVGHRRVVEVRDDVDLLEVDREDALP